MGRRGKARAYSSEPTAGDELVEVAGLSPSEYEGLGQETAEKVGGGAGMRRRAFDQGLPVLPGVRRSDGVGR